MVAPVTISDSLNGVTTRVTKYGQLVVAPLAYGSPIEIDLSVINTAYNFVAPIAGHSIVITDIIAFANKDVSQTDPADIEIYQADAPDTVTVSKSILKPKLLRGGAFSGIGLNMLVPEGKWINAKTSDNIISMTLIFYRVPVEDV